MGDMTRLLLLLLWVGVAVSTPVDVQKRIIGGDKCDDKERQYHVKLIGKNRTHENLCGGSLISDSWILTAAHCQMENITAFLGFHPNGPGTPVVITEPPKIYENNSHKHDIMLLKLPNPTQINPVKLPDCTNSPTRGAKVQVAGVVNETLGAHKERVDTGKTDKLLCVDLGIVKDSHKSCRDASNYGNTHFKLYEAPNKDKDTSPGDSGGGVVYNGMIYGVHAFGRNGTHACVGPAGFVDVCQYQTWIMKVLMFSNIQNNSG